MRGREFAADSLWNELLSSRTRLLHLCFICLSAFNSLAWLLAISFNIEIEVSKIQVQVPPVMPTDKAGGLVTAREPLGGEQQGQGQTPTQV